MATPREILERTNRKQSDSVEKTAVVQQPEGKQLERTMTMQPVRQNSVYRRLMASHDRVHTRHLKG